jgi:hypothetical protein
MASVPRDLLLIVSTITLLLLARPASVTAQPTSDLQLSYNQAIIQVHKTELAGATSNQVRELVALLNRANDLNEQADRLTSPTDAQTRAQLLVQVNQTLNDVETNASQIETTASQRTLTNKVLAYGSGGIAAFAGTVAYYYGVSFWRKYRIKRTFQMRIIPK